MHIQTEVWEVELKLQAVGVSSRLVQTWPSLVLSSWMQA